MQKDLYNAITGFAVGDAMGVPYEFKKRGTYHCTNMRASTFKDSHFPLPLGSWSDDTSLMLCVLDALTIKKHYDAQETPPMSLEKIKERHQMIKNKVYNRFKKNAIAWMYLGRYTNHGYRIPFDIGNSCKIGITSMMFGMKNKKANKITSNGNGGLMRILPLAFLDIEDDNEILEYIKLFNECSHNHEISNIGCLIYIKIAQTILKNKHSSTREVVKKAIHSISDKYKIDEYKRIWDLSIIDTNLENIKSTGYVVDTLEAVVWCLTNNFTYEDTVLFATNLGGDTDTISALVGGLAGMYYNLVPESWINNTRRQKMLKEMCKKFEGGIL